MTAAWLCLTAPDRAWLRLAGCAPERRRVSAAELATSLPPRIAAAHGADSLSCKAAAQVKGRP